MGLNIETNNLLPDGPIALKSRNEVVNSVVSFLKSIEFNINSEDLKIIFKEVHENFSIKVNHFYST